MLLSALSCLEWTQSVCTSTSHDRCCVPLESENMSLALSSVLVQISIVQEYIAGFGTEDGADETIGYDYHKDSPD